MLGQSSKRFIHDTALALKITLPFKKVACWQSYGKTITVMVLPCTLKLHGNIGNLSVFIYCFNRKLCFYSWFSCSHHSKILNFFMTDKRGWFSRVRFK